MPSAMNQSETDREALLRLASSLVERTRNLSPDLPVAELRQARHLLEEVAALLPAVGETATGRGLRGVVSGLRTRLGGAESETQAPQETRSRDGFSGRGECVGLPSVLNFLGLLGKTGRLSVYCDEETLSLDFEEGKLVCAWSDHAPPGQRLGEILVAIGTLEQGRLDSFLTNYSRASGWMGQALEREGLVTGKQLKDAVKVQTQHLFHRLFAVTTSWFTFVDGRQPRPEGVSAMNVNALLLESARQSDERAA